jgi:2-polyprenyl-6-methoxyphenol hydroxylase-like FAD-dependent oxidoreductase
MRFLHRRQFIQILFDNLKDKSRIHTSAEVVKTEITESGVVVETKDGSKYSGSILVGTDGVHSRVRQEMWRIADAEKPGFISDAERNCK